MSKLPRMNVIERQVAAAIDEANSAAELTGDDLETVQGGAQPTFYQGLLEFKPRDKVPPKIRPSEIWHGPLPMYGTGRPFELGGRPGLWDKIPGLKVGK